MEPDSRDNRNAEEPRPEKDTPKDWFNLGCSLIAGGKTAEAERALRIAVDMQENYPIAWAILSAVLLSQGHETDAEQAGKVALDQCKDLRMTWPKLRSVIFNHAIKRGKSWKSPKRISIDSSDGSEWSAVLQKLGESSNVSLDDIKIAEEKKELSESEVQMATEVVPDVKFSQTISEISSDSPIREEVESKSAAALFHTARFHLNAKEYDKAERAYMRGLTIDPENGDALLRVGILLMRREAYVEAEESLRHSLKVMPQNAEAWLQLGICLQEMERWAESFKTLIRAKEITPRNAEVWVKLGEADYYRSLYENAARSFLRALRIEPEHMDALFYLARCMEYRNNKNHALRIYRKLLNLNPEDPELLEELSKSFHRLGSPIEAQRAKSMASQQRRKLSNRNE